MAESAEKKKELPAGRRIPVARWVGLLVALLGLWQMFEAMSGDEPRTVARLFFPSDKVESLVRDAVALSAPFAQACADESLKAVFDSVSVRRFERWCKAVNRFAGEPAPAAATALLRAGNVHLGRIVEKLAGSGGPAARRGVDLFEASGVIRPTLEQINSQLAGAAFSQGLIGALLATVGGFLLFRRKAARVASTAS